MKTVEYWRWRYRNVETGRICRTMFPCSVEEARVIATIESKGGDDAEHGPVSPRTACVA